MFLDAVEQEKQWADYLFKDGSIIGLNAELLKQYIEFIAGKRMHAPKLETDLILVQIHLDTKVDKRRRSTSSIQETEPSSYVIGGTKQDVDKDLLKDLVLKINKCVQFAHIM